MLQRKSLLKRMQNDKKLREGKDVEIVDYQPQYKEIFKQLNEEWITTWFKMEEATINRLTILKNIYLIKAGIYCLRYIKVNPLEPVP
ncbi:MAG: hypothetical protein JWP44_1217 [Mucilaginibacter sp.]|nr:hypothetical protein [Mucilaginibacter sp.]